MLDIWEAERLEDVLGTGRTYPLVIECVRRATATPEGERRDPGGGRGSDRRVMVVKALGLPEVTPSSPCAELFGSLLARELGIDTPSPALVDLASLSDDRLDWLEACMPEPWRPWTARVRRHLVAVRMHLSEFGWELRRSLA